MCTVTEIKKKEKSFFFPLIARIIFGVGNRIIGPPDIGVIVNSTNDDEYLPKRPPIFITVIFFIIHLKNEQNKF